MSAVNFASLPAIASPNAVAASFADLTAAARIRCRTLTRIPVLKPNLDGGSEAAFLDTLTFSSNDKCPDSTALKAK